MINTKAQDIIKEFTKNTYKKIKVVPGKCRYNYKCHLNSVHDAIVKKDKKVAMCLCIQRGEVYIHFINYHNGKFVDNTLGVWSATNDYYFVRWIKEDEFFEITSIFISFRGFLQRQLPWWIRITNTETF